MINLIVMKDRMRKIYDLNLIADPQPSEEKLDFYEKESKRKVGLLMSDAKYLAVYDKKLSDEVVKEGEEVKNQLTELFTMHRHLWLDKEDKEDILIQFTDNYLKHSNLIRKPGQGLLGILEEELNQILNKNVYDGIKESYLKHYINMLNMGKSKVLIEI